MDLTIENFGDDHIVHFKDFGRENMPLIMSRFQVELLLTDVPYFFAVYEVALALSRYVGIQLVDLRDLEMYLPEIMAIQVPDPNEELATQRYVNIQRVDPRRLGFHLPNDNTPVQIPEGIFAGIIQRNLDLRDEIPYAQSSTVIVNPDGEPIVIQATWITEIECAAGDGGDDGGRVIEPAAASDGSGRVIETAAAGDGIQQNIIDQSNGVRNSLLTGNENANNLDPLYDPNKMDKK